MTVSELIAKLQQFDPRQEVRIWEDHRDQPYTGLANVSECRLDEHHNVWLPEIFVALYVY